MGVEMSAVKTGSGGLMWHAHVSELSDNDKVAIMQIKELKEVLNSQRVIICFTLEEVESMMCDIYVDWLILTYDVCLTYCAFWNFNL